MKKIFFLLLFLPLVLAGQPINKWKEVTVEDFRTGETYKNYPAVIISEQGHYYFDVVDEKFQFVYEVTRKIYIANEEGKRYAHVILKYAQSQYFEDIPQFTAYIYSLKGNSVARKRVRAKYFSQKHLDKVFSVREMNIPDIEPGSILVYKYVIVTHDIINVRPWFFQHEIPVVLSKFRFEQPAFMGFAMDVRGRNLLDVDKNEVYNKTLTYFFRYEDPIPAGLSYANGSFNSNVSFVYEVTAYTMEMSNVQPYRNEPFTDCVCNSRYGVKLYLLEIDANRFLSTPFEHFAWDYMVRPLYQATLTTGSISAKIYSGTAVVPSDVTVYKANDWRQIDNDLLRSVEFGKRISRKWNSDDILAEALKDNPKDNLDKMIAIFRYVRENYKWNGKYSLFAEKPLQKVVKQQEGNSAEINFLLIYLLKKSGIKVVPVILSTVNNGRINKQIVSYAQFNNVIARVEIGDKVYYLDASASDARYNLPPENDLTLGRVVNPLNAQFVEIVPATETKASFEADIEIKTADKIAICSLNVEKTGYFSVYETKDDSLKNNLLQGLKNINIKNFSVHRKDGQLEVSSVFSTSAIFEGQKMYPFDVFIIKNPFLSPKHSHEIYLKYPFEYEYIVNLTVPQNYKLVAFPLDFSAKQDGYEITTTNKFVDKNKATLTIKIKSSRIYYKSEDYKVLRQMYMQLADYLSSAVVYEPEN